MRIALYISLLVLCTIYAVWRGGAPERAIALSYFSTWILDSWVHFFTPAEYAEMDPGHFVIDLVLWIAFFAISLRANRFWPLCIVSLQTIALVAHIAKLMDVSIHPQAYYIMQVASSYPLLVTIAIGTFCHQRRLKTKGTDPSWRS